MKYTISDEPKQYQIVTGTRKTGYTTIETVTGVRVEIEGYKKYEFFLHELEQWGFRVSEKTTGASISDMDWYPSKEEAVKIACKCLRNHGKKLFEHLRQGLIEKYGEVNEKHS